MKLRNGIYFYEGSPVSRANSRQTLHRGMGSSNFLVLTGASQIMIDSGFYFGPHQDRIRREMATDGIRLEDTAQVLFSHAHPDHIQMAKQLCKRQKLQLSIHRDNELFIRSEQFQFEAYYNYPEPIKREIMFLPKPLARLAFRLLGFGFDYLKVDHLFNSGSKIDWGDGIQTMDIPGHCLGHVGFHFPRDRLFYAADLLFEGRGNYPVLPCVTNALSNMTTGLSDIDRVAALDIDVMIPGHGQAVFGKADIAKVLAAAKSNAQRLMSDCLASIAKKRQTLSQLTHQLFKTSNGEHYVFNVAIMYQTLIHLHRQKLLKSQSVGNKIYWHCDY